MAHDSSCYDDGDDRSLNATETESGNGNDVPFVSFSARKPFCFVSMIFLSLFSVLRDRHAVVTVELKNNVQLRGTIDSVDQYLNIKLGNVEVVNKEQYPHLVVLTVTVHPSESH